MSVDTTLAQMSNVLVYSSMAAYAGALLGYATDLSGRGRTVRRGRAGRAGAGQGAGRLRRTGRRPGSRRRLLPATTAPGRAAPWASRPRSPGSPPGCTWSPC